MTWFCCRVINSPVFRFKQSYHLSKLIRFQLLRHLMFSLTYVNSNVIRTHNDLICKRKTNHVDTLAATVLQNPLFRRDKNQSEFYSKQGLFEDVLYCVRDPMFCVTTVYAIVTLLVMLPWHQPIQPYYFPFHKSYLMQWNMMHWNTM